MPAEEVARLCAATLRNLYPPLLLGPPALYQLPHTPRSRLWPRGNDEQSYLEPTRTISAYHDWTCQSYHNSRETTSRCCHFRRPKIVPEG
ncbi:hypothetical protein VTJ04DRAFT_6472 [Mycothermus thermophilus]|uniref:uncharacterized protein n=1 Tax=Humicola insolens TaxID=85995 RepID=UPI0037441EBB